jgi:hypothetical protein
MENNLFANITNSSVRYKAANNNLNTKAPFYSNIVSITPAKADFLPTFQLSNCETNRTFSISIDGAEKKIDENTVLKSSFIAYKIRITRITDSEIRFIWKRYREIHDFFTKVSNLPEIISSKAELPRLSNIWLSKQLDPNSEFIQNRLIEIQVWPINCDPNIVFL